MSQACAACRPSPLVYINCLPAPFTPLTAHLATPIVHRNISFFITRWKIDEMPHLNAGDEMKKRVIFSLARNPLSERNAYDAKCALRHSDLSFLLNGLMIFLIHKLPWIHPQIFVIVHVLLISKCSWTRLFHAIEISHKSKACISESSKNEQRWI